MITLHQGDCRDVLKTLADNSIDSCCTDPPYALVSVVKRFGSPNAAPAKGNDAYMRASAGFMGKSWDTGETAFSVEFWSEVLRVLKPGAFVAAFGASRGYHRMACAIEDAGFEIRDSLLHVIDPSDQVVAFMESLNDEQLGAFLRCIDDSQMGGTLAWMYGTGFPKSQNVAKFIDKELGIDGAKGAVTGKSGAERSCMAGDFTGGEYHEYIPGSPQAQEFDGFGTALKPAFEPIVLARKPLSEGTVAANVLRWRTGALNIDGCRVPSDTPVQKAAGSVGFAAGRDDNYAEGTGREYSNAGRWPANVVLTYPEETYTIRANVDDQQRAELETWLAENAEH